MAMPGIAVRGQRSLLRQIREALASGGPAQSRLDIVVRIIARSMVAEVCSLYMRRASGDKDVLHRPFSPPIRYTIQCVHLDDRPPSKAASQFITVFSKVLREARE